MLILDYIRGPSLYLEDLPNGSSKEPKWALHRI